MGHVEPNLTDQRSLPAVDGAAISRNRTRRTVSRRKPQPSRISSIGRPRDSWMARELHDREAVDLPDLLEDRSPSAFLGRPVGPAGDARECLEDFVRHVDRQALGHRARRLHQGSARVVPWIRGLSAYDKGGPASSADPVFLDLPIQGPLADAQELGGLLAVALGELQGLGDVVLLDLVERAADQVLGARRLGRAGEAACRSSVRSSRSRTPSVSMTTMLSMAFFSSRTLPGQG